jgi:hypothetical protein
VVFCCLRLICLHIPVVYRNRSQLAHHVRPLNFFCLCFVQSKAVTGGASWDSNNWWTQPGCTVSPSAWYISATTQLSPRWRATIHVCSRTCISTAGPATCGTAYWDPWSTFPAPDASPALLQGRTSLWTYQVWLQIAVGIHLCVFLAQSI